MVAVTPNISFAPAHPVDRTRKTNRQPGHSPGEGERVVRLDDEMDVILLDREVNHTKPRTRSLGERAPNPKKHYLLS
jgi:hypothetical protein